MVTLGLRPLEVDVLLPRDADFVASLISDDEGGWPEGVEIALVFSTSPRLVTPAGLRWEAALEGGTAAWDVPSVTVAAVIAAGATHARLLYTEADGTVLLWGKGAVRVV